MRAPTPLGLSLIAALMLASCAEDGQNSGLEDTDAITDTSEAEVAVDDCGCDSGCPDSACNLRVTLAPTCTGVVESATVLIEGAEVGAVTLEAPFASCEVFACDAPLEVEVRSREFGFSTGARTLPNPSLVEDVPIDCSNF